MKKTATIQILGALAIAAALTMTTASCSSEDNMVANPEQPVQKQGTTVTVSASIADDAMTRSMVEESKDDNGIKRTLKFTEGDQLYVYNRYDIYPVKGMLTMVENSLSADGKSASFTGSLQRKIGNSWKDYTNYGDKDPLDGTTATLVHKDMVENTDYRFDGYYQIEFPLKTVSDIETLMTRNLHVTGDYNISTKSFALSSDDVIFNCVFTGLAASTEYYCQLRYPFSPGYIVTGGHSFTTDANGMSSHAFCFPDPGGAHPWEIEIELNSTSTTIGTIALGERTLEKKIYNVSRRWNGSAFVAGIDLATMNDSYTAQNGDMLTGVFGAGEETKCWNVKIAAGATVVLNGVDITNVKDDNNRLAGIECLGDATIILSGTNTVKNGSYYKPAILVPSGKNLTIRGSGKLTADASNSNAAGIGGGNGDDCGNIIIEGGDITATGAGYSAGIGGGYNHSCGTIEIRGGTVTATGGYGAGIGSGDNSSCGTITISGGSVTAEGGYGAGIGSGYADGGGTSTCGTITISGGNVTATGGIGAGIGSGYADDGGTSTCGAITISGGNVTATGGSGAGIGSGNTRSGGTSTCGAITIYDTVTKVTASKRTAECSIGKGPGTSSTCGTVIIGGTEYWGEDPGNAGEYIYKNDGATYLKQNPLVYP